MECHSGINEHGILPRLASFMHKTSVFERVLLKGSLGVARKKGCDWNVIPIHASIKRKGFEERLERVALRVETGRSVIERLTREGKEEIGIR